MGFRLQQRLMTLNVNLLLCHYCYAYCDQMAEDLELRRFRCKVALYRSYSIVSLTTKFKGIP